MRKKAVIGLHQRIINSPCYLFNGSYNSCCLVALTKYICLERQLIKAYYTLCIAAKHFSESIDSSQSEARRKESELHALHNIENAIVSYNNCVDTLLQIVYFVFEFVPCFYKADDFTKYLKQCRWERIKSKFKKYLNNPYPNPKAFVVYDRLDRFYSGASAIRDLANAIKHHGGLTTAKSKIPCPPGLTLPVKCPFNFPLALGDDLEKLIKETGDDIFNPAAILPTVVDFEFVIKQLENQTDKIYDFAHFIFRESGLLNATEQNINIRITFHPTFSVQNSTT